MRLRWAILTLVLVMLDGSSAQDVTYRWVYRNPFSIFDPKAVDYGKGSRNGTVNSPLSAIPTTYQPRLRYSHMATLSHLPNGSIAAQWQANTKWFEGAANQSIYWSISDDGGLTWGPTRVLLPSPDTLPIWGPVQHAENGTLHLWYSKSHSACSWVSSGGVCWAPGGDMLFSTSRDMGQTWNTTTIVPWSYEGGIARLTCNSISLNAKGEWLLPYWRELGGGPVCQKEPSLHGTAGVLITADQGKTYTKVNVPKDNRTWMIENAIAQYAAPVEGTDMHVQTFRTATGVALESWSSDGGYNWTFPVNSTLPNPNSRMDIVSLPNNTLVAAFNDSPNKRTPLRLATSADGGLTWTRGALIEDDPEGSFHYPALLYDAAKDIVMVIYTVGYPPRLVPVSLVLPGLDVRSGSVFAPYVAPAPAPAPARSATAAALSANAPAPAAARSASAPAPAAAGLATVVTAPGPLAEPPAADAEAAAAVSMAPAPLMGPGAAPAPTPAARRTSPKPPVNTTLSRVLGVKAAAAAGIASPSPDAKAFQASTLSASTNRTASKAPAPAPAASREAARLAGTREGDREALSRIGRRLAQALAPSTGSGITAPGQGAMEKTGTSALFPAARAALQAEDVLAHIQGGLDDVSMDELAENAALADEHAELLTAHGYRLVEGLPGFVLEPSDRGVRDLDGGTFQRNSDPGAYASLSQDEGESQSSQEGVVGRRRRRLLKDRFVKEESDYGRVNYGLRVATVDRHALVNGLISRK